MENNNSPIFNLQRFLIIQTKLNPEMSDTIPDDYAYAWFSGVYPYFDESKLHSDLEEYFPIRKKQVEIILNYVDSEWLKKKYYTFYELEDHFQCRTHPIENIDRIILMKVLRYAFLRGTFDNQLWNKILENGQYPVEVGSITRNLSANELFFI